MLTKREVMNYLKSHKQIEYKELRELGFKQPDKFSKKIEIYQETIKEEGIIIHDDLELPDVSKNTTLHYLDNYYNWDECKQLSDKCLKDKDKFIVFVSKCDIFKGRFINEILPYQQEIKLATLCNYIGGENRDLLKTIYFIDSKRDKRKYNQEKTIEKRFWVYQFESEHREYVILSEERQTLENCIIEGTLIKLEDEFKIGESRTLSKTLPIILLYKITKSKAIFRSNKELIEKMKKIKLNHKKLFNWIFSLNGDIYEQPDYFNYLVTAFLLSAKEEFPLHLMIMGKTGIGKSKVEKCILEKFDETNAILDGSLSTMKSLIPSFKGILPDTGVILKSNRICVIDEFFRILMRVRQEDRRTQLSALNPILEHQNNIAGSGNGNINTHPTARLYSVSNPIWGTTTMIGLADKIDNSFLSRLLIWYQDDKHIKFIEERKGKKFKQIKFSMDKDLWLGIIDYLHSFKAEWDRERVNLVIEKGKLMLGDDTEENTFGKVRDVYMGRCNHHINCLMDGIIKTRCICNQDNKFKAIEKDYQILENLWFRMLEGWGVVGNDIEKSLLHSQMY